MRTSNQIYAKGWNGPITNQQMGWDASRTHGMSGTPTYQSWARMIQRCRNPNNKRFADYGGPGNYRLRALASVCKLSCRWECAPAV